MTNFLSLDLELNQPSGKIVQVGIAVGNPEQGVIDTKSWFLDPEEIISPRIVDLTGITDDIIAEQAVSHATMAEELSSCIKEYEPFVNPVQWGSGDRDVLIKEMKERQIEFPFFGRRELDVKQIYTYLSLSQGKKPNGGLRSCMGRYKMPFNGKPHRADVDASNTLRFFFGLLARQTLLEKCVLFHEEILFRPLRYDSPSNNQTR